MRDVGQSIEAFRDSVSGLSPPVIVFCKSHSGSRLLARLMMAGGIWLGDQRNDSEDSAEMLSIVRLAVLRHYPAFTQLLRDGDPDLIDLARSVVEAHVRGRPHAMPWGWKLCETGYALPLFRLLFPGATFIHLIRDGRDVAFCNHVHPADDFWRKVYFGTKEIRSWQGRAISARAYLRQPHVFNAQHWVNSVTTARHYGAMLGQNYIEIRYEDIVRDPLGQMRQLFSSLALDLDEAAVAKVTANVHNHSMGKFRQMPAAWQRDSRAVLSPTLEAFGYGLDDAPVPRPAEQLQDFIAAALRRMGKLVHAS